MRHRLEGATYTCHHLHAELAPTGRRSVDVDEPISILPHFHIVSRRSRWHTSWGTFIRQHLHDYTALLFDAIFYLHIPRSVLVEVHRVVNVVLCFKVGTPSLTSRGSHQNGISVKRHRT